MRWRNVIHLLWMLAAGCSTGLTWNDRPPTTPAPADVQAEIRDARYFLPLPDRALGPESGMFPRGTQP